MSLSRGGVLTLDDARMIEKRVKGLKAVCPASYRRMDISYNGKSMKSDISGTTEALAQVQDINVDGGRFLSPGDVEYERRVIVLSQEVKDYLFGKEKAENEGVVINGTKFRVIGVEKNSTPVYSSFFSGKCYIPITVFNRMFNSQSISEISVAAKDSSLLKPVTDRSVALLLNKYGDGSIKIINLSEEMQNAQNIIDIFKTVIGAVAAISLIVGGIGIMNVMLITVKERTREIGIRKAIGASEHHILGQFLAEAIIYSLIGGILGVVLGSFFTLVSAAVLQVHAVISLTSILLSVLFCITVGVFFGIFPAIKASKLNPVEALRNE